MKKINKKKKANAKTPAVKKESLLSLDLDQTTREIVSLKKEIADVRNFTQRALKLMDEAIAKESTRVVQREVLREVQKIAKRHELIEQKLGSLEKEHNQTLQAFLNSLMEKDQQLEEVGTGTEERTTSEADVQVVKKEKVADLTDEDPLNIHIDSDPQQTTVEVNEEEKSTEDEAKSFTYGLISEYAMKVLKFSLTYFELNDTSVKVRDWTKPQENETRKRRRSIATPVGTVWTNLAKVPTLSLDTSYPSKTSCLDEHMETVVDKFFIIHGETLGADENKILQSKERKKKNKSPIPDVTPPTQWTLAKKKSFVLKGLQTVNDRLTSVHGSSFGCVLPLSDINKDRLLAEMLRTATA